MSIYKCTILNLIFINTVFSGMFGNECLHNRKKSKGICKLPSNCSSSILEDITKGIFPQMCSFRYPATVCCVKDKRNTVGEKSRQMCKQYENLSYVWQSDPVLIVSELYRHNICPWEPNGLTVIYGGEKVNIGEFPHMALIGYGMMKDIHWQCGGALISEKFVVTAGHCLYSRQYGKPVLVRLGDLNYTDYTDDEFTQNIAIKVMHLHPDYKYPSTYHDIALLELEHPANLNINVKPICIYTKEKLPSTVIATGWGDTEENKHSDYLLKTVLDTFNKTRCAATYRKSKFFPMGLRDNIQMCAGSVHHIRDTCLGDSGGPVQIYNEDVTCSYYLLGITSHGKTCGLKNSPSVYVRIYPYIEWIETIVWP